MGLVRDEDIFTLVIAAYISLNTSSLIGLEKSTPDTSAAKVVCSSVMVMGDTLCGIIDKAEYCNDYVMYTNRIYR